MKSIGSVIPALCAAGLVLAWSPAASPDDQGAGGRAVRATAQIKGCTDPNITGRAFLTERPSAEGVKLVDVTVVVTGLPPGKHAVHIHEVGACTPCSAAKGHFDPGPVGDPTPDGPQTNPTAMCGTPLTGCGGNHPFHSGDLINLVADNTGVGVMHTTTSRITLSPGPLSIFDADGSAIIVHVNPDTYCPDGPQVSGCAGGARQACGVIELAPAEDQGDDQGSE